MDKLITLIVSVDKVNTDTELYITKFVDSLTKQTKTFNEVIVVGSKGDKTKLVNLFKGIKSEVFIDDSETSTNQTRYNLGLDKAKSDYVSFTTYEMMLRPKYVEICERYIAKDTIEAAAFLPIELREDCEGNKVGFTNEFAWTNVASNDVVGTLKYDYAKEYAGNTSIYGIVVKRVLLTAVGGFKTGLKFGYSVEFLLRITKMGGTVRIIPKLIGARVVDLPTEENFLIESTDVEEIDFWVDKAYESCTDVTDEQFVYEKTNVHVEESK